MRDYIRFAAGQFIADDSGTGQHFTAFNCAGNVEELGDLFEVWQGEMIALHPSNSFSFSAITVWPFYWDLEKKDDLIWILQTTSMFANARPFSEDNDPMWSELFLEKSPKRKGE
jgi:hypothetical protein